MTEPLIRLAVLTALVGAAWLVVGVLERRRPVLDRGRAGITLVTAEGCMLCIAALESLRRHGPELALRLLDPKDAPARFLSVPTVLVTDSGGEVILRRSGQSAVGDAALLVEAARRVVGAGG